MSVCVCALGHGSTLSSSFIWLQPQKLVSQGQTHSREERASFSLTPKFAAYI